MQPRLHPVTSTTVTIQTSKITFDNDRSSIGDPLVSCREIIQKYANIWYKKPPTTPQTKQIRKIQNLINRLIFTILSEKDKTKVIDNITKNIGHDQDQFTNEIVNCIQSGDVYDVYQVHIDKTHMNTYLSAFFLAFKTY